MPNIINELNVDRILLDLHQFLKAFPSSVWRDLPSDTPLRTVKTILHSLAKILGQKVGLLLYFILVGQSLWQLTREAIPGKILIFFSGATFQACLHEYNILKFVLH